MRRQQRKRTTRRRGLQNIGEALASILTDIDQIEEQEQQTHRGNTRIESSVPALAPANLDTQATFSSQNTFSFYQAAEM